MKNLCCLIQIYSIAHFTPTLFVSNLFTRTQIHSQKQKDLHYKYIRVCSFLLYAMCCFAFSVYIIFCRQFSPRFESVISVHIADRISLAQKRPAQGKNPCWIFRICNNNNTVNYGRCVVRCASSFQLSPIFGNGCRLIRPIQTNQNRSDVNSFCILVITLLASLNEPPK